MWSLGPQFCHFCSMASYLFCQVTNAVYSAPITLTLKEMRKEENTHTHTKKNRGIREPLFTFQASKQARNSLSSGFLSTDQPLDE